MLAIGERINVRTKVLGEAMANRDFGPIKEMAIKQVKAGANMLDINIGPARKNGPELMEWLVKIFRKWWMYHYVWILQMQRLWKQD